MLNNIKQIINSDFISLNSELEITESSNSATINKITFTNAEFININPDIISFLNVIFSDTKLCKGFPLCDELTFQQKCDGIFLAKKNESWYLCVCELKSTLNKENFLKAKAQLEVSLLKTLMILEILKPIDNLKISCFIISSVPQNNIGDKLKQLRHRNIDNKTPGQLAYQRLINTKSCLIEDNICLLSSFPIKDKFLLKNSTIFFFEGNNNHIDILNYLN